MSALVVTANKHMTQSLISESLADRMFKARDGWKEGWKKKDDRWILIDLSWPFDAASQTLRDDGSLVCFESKRVRFLIVPHREMKKGIILAKDVLEDQRLRVTKGSHQTYLGADGKREEGVLLHGFQVNILNAAASDRPFERLCRLAEFAATRKPKKNENLLFRQQIQDEVRRNHLQIR
uniref:Uncharacterized protein n=2 Tax=Kalmanozyma brasiliensis (strain GHG001) TaxID=1365824 RepID=V5EYY0_KALBG